MMQLSQKVGRDTVSRLAERYDVPIEDVLLIAVNLFGIWSDQQHHRARLTVRLAGRPDVTWTVVVPLNAAGSPFTLRGTELRLAGDVVAEVHRVNSDDAAGGYFRDEGRAATLNPNARSRCVGCAFCPNTLEAAADPRLSRQHELADLLDALVEQHPRRDLSQLREVTVSTGCFEREAAALDHLLSLRGVLSARKLTPRIGFLTSVLRSDQAFQALADRVTPFVLRLTVECLTRRSLMLKASKAELDVEQMPDLLARAKCAGLGTSFTYIVGLDPLDELRSGVTALMEHTSEFPNFQVYQAHNSIMAGLRTPGADELEFYLQARREIEQITAPSGLRPQAWEGYRPLWYFTFAGQSLVGAR